MDDNLLVGHPAAIEDTIKKMRKNGLILKVEGDLKDYLSCKIKIFKDKKKAWLGQPHLISNQKKTFGEQIKLMRNYLTLGL